MSWKFARRTRPARPARPAAPAVSLNSVRRINPDAFPVILVSTITASLLLAASFLWSWDALVDVSAWAGVRPARGWVVPVVLDGATFVYTLAVLVQRARGEKAVLAWVALTGFTGVSVYFNAAHAWDAGEALDEWQRTAGTALAGLAPVAVLFATHTIANLLVSRVSPLLAAGAEMPPAPVPAPVVEDVSTAPLDLAAVRETAPVPALSVPPVSVRASRPARRPSPTSLSSETRDEALRLRTEESLTVDAIAERLGVSRATAGRLVAGVPRSVSTLDVPTLVEAAA